MSVKTLTARSFESDHVPFLTPAQLRAAMARDAHARMLGQLHRLNLSQTEIVVRSGGLAEVLAELVAERYPHYLVTGPLKWGALSKLAGLAADPRVASTRCDVMHVGAAEDHWSGRLSRWAGRWLLGDEPRLP